MDGTWRRTRGRTLATFLILEMVMGITRGEVSSRCQEVITAQREACVVPGREGEQRQFGASARLDIEGLKADSPTLPPGQLDQCCVGFIELDTSGCLCEDGVVDEIMEQGQLTTATEVYNLFSVSDLPAPFGCQITLRVDYDNSGECSIIYPSEFFLESFFPQFLPLYSCVDGVCTRTGLSRPPPEGPEMPGGTTPPTVQPTPDSVSPTPDEEPPPPPPPVGIEQPPLQPPPPPPVGIEQPSPQPPPPSPTPEPSSTEERGGVGVGGGAVGIGGGAIGGGGSIGIGGGTIGGGGSIGTGGGTIGGGGSIGTGGGTIGGGTIGGGIGTGGGGIGTGGGTIGGGTIGGGGIGTGGGTIGGGSVGGSKSPSLDAYIGVFLDLRK